MLTVFSLIVLLFSVMIHEISHGSAAYSLGDLTAKYAGRLTLNPIKHLDLFGSIVLPLLLVASGSPFVIGWAKPVPINPYNFKDQKWGTVKVSLAGPGSNFALAIFFGLIIRFVPLPSAVASLFGIIVLYNLLLGIFNLVPIPPLDGSHILFKFLPQSWSGIKMLLQQYGIFILLFFIIFGFGYLQPVIYYLYNLIVG